MITPARLSLPFTPVWCISYLSASSTVVAPAMYSAARISVIGPFLFIAIFIHHTAKIIQGLDMSKSSARPFDIAWARNTIEQCREAGVAVFVKQLGAKSFELRPTYDLATQTRPLRRYALARADRKGGDMLEWPEDLRVREFPR